MEGKSKGEPANSGSPGKWLLKLGVLYSLHLRNCKGEFRGNFRRRVIFSKTTRLIKSVCFLLARL